MPLNSVLALHAVIAPAASSLSALLNFKRFNFTTPLQTAAVFFGFVLVADAALVAPVFEKSYAMFASIWGTWIPIVSIFLAALDTGNAVTRATRDAFPGHSTRC